MTLDAEVRALERTARARPDDGAAQLGLAAALSRLGKTREATEAFIRAAAAEPGEPEIAAALERVAWWTGPRGQGGGTRALAVAGARERPALVKARKLGEAGQGLAVARGVVLARISKEKGEAHVEALALASGRMLWACDESETVLAAAPPLVARDAIIDAVVFVEKRSARARLRVRPLSLVTGKALTSWCTELDLDLPPGATPVFAGAALSGSRVVLGIEATGKKTFEHLLKVFDVETGARLEATSSVRGLDDLALEGDRLVLSATREDRRVEARRLPSGERIFTAARDESTQRVAIESGLVLAATEHSLIAIDRESGEERWRLDRRRLGGSPDALVVSPRLVVGSWQREGVRAFDLATGEGRWRDEPAAKLLAAAEDTLYAVSPEGLRVRALDLATGELLWEQDLSALRAGVSFGAGVHKLAVAPSRIVGLTKDGVVFLLASEVAF